VVLVHSGFVDGSGWDGIHSDLKSDGYDVTVVQNPMPFPANDWPSPIAQAKGPVVLVGHSYGGVVVTGAGNAPKMAGLV
jgi:pimeloyl-ACP methyl ester carboxylesterase